MILTSSSMEGAAADVAQRFQRFDRAAEALWLAAERPVPQVAPTALDSAPGHCMIVAQELWHMRRSKRAVMQEIHRLNEMIDELTEGRKLSLEECSNPGVAGLLSAVSSSLLWAMGHAPHPPSMILDQPRSSQG